MIIKSNLTTMKHFFYITLSLLCAICLSCEKETLTEDYASLMSLKVENNQAESNNQDRVKIVAEFPANFSTKNSKTVDFYIDKDKEEKQSADIHLVQENGVNKMIAEIYVTHIKAEILKVRAVLTINTVEVSKHTTVEFVRKMDYTSQLSLVMQNDGADADNYDQIHLIAEIPYDFPTVIDDNVDFIISKEIEEKITAKLKVVESADGLKKIAEVYVKSNKIGVLTAKAVLRTGELEVAKQINIHFTQAYPENITISASSLEVKAKSFATITITTQLSRDNGVVSLNSIANTKAFDAAGNSIGIFSDYKNKVDATGKITNLFTLGNSEYVGTITILGETTGVNGMLEPFVLTIFSNP